MVKFAEKFLNMMKLNDVDEMTDEFDEEYDEVTDAYEEEEEIDEDLNEEEPKKPVLSFRRKKKEK